MLISLKPRSIFSVTVIAYALVTVPFAVLALVAAASARQLSADSERLLEGGIRVIEQSRVLEDAVLAMERAARQYSVVGDPALQALFLDRYGELQAALDRLGQAQPKTATPGRAWPLAEIHDEAQAIALVVREADRPSPELTLAVGRFEPIHERVAVVGELARESIQQQAQAMRDSAERSGRRLARLSLILLPAALVLAGLLAVYVVLPLRRMGRAISHLGSGRLNEPIGVGGPLELRALSGQLDWLRERLRSVEKDKNRFLRHMAHELKTPLASVREGSELLADGVLGALTERQQEVANILRNNCFELQTLIENLITYEEWREKSGTLNRTRFALRPLIVQCVQRYRLLLASKRIRIDLRCADFEAYVDHQYLRMALDNLISNALKFSPVGGAVTISAIVSGEAAAGEGGGETQGRTQQLTIEVADEGPGIPFADRARIFEPFYQGPAPPSPRRVEGSGIGLAVVRDCVGAHGGTIEIVDGNFPGAHFRMRLPMPMPQAERVAAPVEARPLRKTA